MLTINLTGVQASPVRQLMGDSNSTFNSSGTTEVYTTVVLTAPRTLTLPAASAFSPGTELIFVDEIGGVTSTNTVTITRAGSDLINGISTLVVSTTSSTVRLITDGVSKWTSNPVTGYSEGSWIPTFTGFSSNPTSVTANYILIGKMCFVSVAMTAGTSNATTFTMSMPFTAAAWVQSLSVTTVVNNSTVATTAGRVLISSGGGVFNFYINGSNTGTWTASGTKGVSFNMCYYIA